MLYFSLRHFRLRNLFLKIYGVVDCCHENGAAEQCSTVLLCLLLFGLASKPCLAGPGPSASTCQTRTSSIHRRRGFSPDTPERGPSAAVSGPAHRDQRREGTFVRANKPGRCLRNTYRPLRPAVDARDYRFDRYFSWRVYSSRESLRGGCSNEGNISVHGHHSLV